MRSEESIYRQDWMNDDQWKCAQVAAKYANGFHHIENLVEWGPGIAIDVTGMVGDLSTYDFNALTRLVVLAHDNCVRIGIKTIERKETYEGRTWDATVLIISFHPRKRDGEKMFERHPRLETHVAEIRAALKGLED